MYLRKSLIKSTDMLKILRYYYQGLKQNQFLAEAEKDSSSFIVNLRKRKQLIKQEIDLILDQSGEGVGDGQQ